MGPKNETKLPTCLGLSGAWTIGTKGPWPPSKFGPRKKRQHSPLDKFFWPPPEPKRGPLTIFRPDPPLWRTSRRHCLDWLLYTRVTLEMIDTPPSPTKTKDLFIKLRFNYSKVFIVGVESFLRLFEPRQEEGKKRNFWKEPQRRLYTRINFPSSQNCHSLCGFSQFWEQERIANG